MSRVICGIIAARQYHVVGWDVPEDYLAECILPFHTSTSPHVVMTPAGRLYLWEEDEDCRCGCRDSPDPEDRCFSTGPITEEGFIEIVMRIISP